MTELDIGLHCSLSDCKQLDFLPFKCDGCSQIFCLDHKGRTAHSCSDINYKNDAKPSASQPIYKCTYHDCNGTELVPVNCSSCKKQFCLAHRLPEDHNCSGLRSDVRPPRDIKVSEIFTKKQTTVLPHATKKKALNAKNQRMAAKVALMKLKQKAVGDKGIPAEERIYFSVKTPNKDDLAMFVSDKWTFGKMIDKIAEANNLTNRNNVSLSNRLMLRNLDSQQDLDFSILIKDAAAKCLVFSGSSLELLHST